VRGVGKIQLRGRGNGRRVEGGGRCRDWGEVARGGRGVGVTTKLS